MSKPKKPKFRVGQVVCLMAFPGDVDEYGTIEGFDDGRWHLKIGRKDRKVMPDILRPLTKRERGSDA